VAVPALATPFKAAETLLVYEPASRAARPIGPEPQPGEIAVGPWAAICNTTHEVRHVAARSARLVAQAKLRAVFAVHVPLGLVSQLAGHGVICLKVDEAGLKALKASKDVQLPAPAALAAAGATVTVGKAKIAVTWIALPTERNWVAGGNVLAGTTAATPKTEAGRTAGAAKAR
jgi:hypothetical protein